MLRSFLPIIILFISFFSFSQNAVYKIEFISNWSSSTHPNMYPSNAHWSPLIGASHKDAGVAFQVGATATDGIEQVAESGGTSIIQSEINALISANLADKIISGSGLGSGPGTITINDVAMNSNFPYVSLITMIAPSPDWVAMIGNQKLTDAGNNWVSSISVDVHAVDAGIDSGSTYTSDDADITPHEPMSSLENTTPFSAQIIGTFKFTLQQVLSTPNETLVNAISVYPNPVKNVISIKNSGNINLKKAEIYSLNGSKIQEIGSLNNQKTIPVNGLNNGIYFLRLYTDKGSLNKKLIVQD